MLALAQRTDRAGVRVLSSASTVSAVTAAVIRHSQVKSPRSVTVFLVPASRHTAHVGAALSLLRAVGQPIRVFCDGRFHEFRGWSQTIRFRMPTPLGMIRGGLWETADAAYLPRIWRSLRNVTMYVDTNTPGVNAFAVAEHAIALMLTTGRKIPRIDREMRGGNWPREMLTQCLGKTLGVFGMGAIGARLATIARGIGMNVLGWSALGDEARIRKAGATPASKEEILARADVVSLHVRLTTETRNFLGRKELAVMKPTAILVNTGRGALVDREALIAALRERRIMGAGLDVFHQEPLAPDDPILSLPNVVVSPHNAGQTPEVIRDGLLAAVANIENFRQGKPSNLVVSPGR